MLLHALIKLRCLFLSFFFFQAEDGIRDYKVTGVQTCALPISVRVVVVVAVGVDEPEPREVVAEAVPRDRRLPDRQRVPDHGHEIGRASCRKECRSRWSPEHEKEKGRTRSGTIANTSHEKQR